LDDIQDKISANELASFFHELADVAGRIALTYFRSSVDFERKQDLTPVTIADRAIEVELRRLISSRFPDHGIVGEEMGSTLGDRYTWYLDPIDGTKSFISGMPLFGTLVALADERDGSVVAGMIDMPALAERWYGTLRGVTFNGKPASFTVVSDTTLMTTIPKGATTGPIAITTGAGTATTGDFTVTLTVTGMTPASGPAGTPVTISGAGFTGTTIVKFNNKTAAFSVQSDTSIQATVPADATMEPVIVTSGGKTTRSEANFTVG